MFAVVEWVNGSPTYLRDEVFLTEEDAREEINYLEAYSATPGKYRVQPLGDALPDSA